VLTDHTIARPAPSRGFQSGFGGQQATDALRLLNGAPSATALVTATETLTYAELDERIRARRIELGGGRRLVMVSGANAVEPVVTYLAALSAGHPVLLVADDRSSPSQEQHRLELIDRYDPDVVFGGGADEWQLEERRGGSSHDLHPELALLLSTSGSSGSPKLVRLSRQNVRSNAESIAAYLSLGPSDRAATTLPMHYSYGLSVLNSHLLAGASLLLTDRSVLEPQFWENFTSNRATSFAGVPYTFDLLETANVDWPQLPNLRYVTQAGGRLGSDRVRRYAELGARHGFEFFAMYGQTEATARMSYLPPELAATHPASIGIPIPGGAFRIDTGDGGEGGDTVGELVYSGPNVMLGYAERPADLAAGRSITELYTGDLARQNAHGLYEIVGRTSRFVKIFGLRVDLDRVEQILAEDGIAARAVDLDERLVVLVRDEWALGLAGPVAAEALGLPAHHVRAHLIAEFPVTPNGKPDIPRAREYAAEREADVHADPASGGAAPGGTSADSTAEHIRALYATILNRVDASVDDSFVTLHGDSLDYVEVSVRLEQMLGTLPRNWPEQSARQLAGAHTTVDAKVQRSRRSKRWLAGMETPLVLRALAIVLVVGTHANLLALQGGAHLLLGVLGFNLARFQFADVPRTSRIRNLARSASSIFIPAVLWIGTVSLVGGGYQPATVFLVNGWLGDGDHWSTQWQYWFLETVLWTMIGLIALVALPRLDRVERQFPFLVAGAIVVLALGLRVLVIGGVQAGPVERYTLPGVLWLIALGWFVARATEVKRRLVASVVIVLAVPGFFGDPVREAVIIAGLLLLLWISVIPVPRILVPAVSVVASASLFVYLVHWQVYPALQDDFPLLATLASFAAGILVWRGYSRLTGWCATAFAAGRSTIRARTSGR
jgi:acyl-CoA synthetase (AMP-forming)/AMP-acid ligase II